MSVAWPRRAAVGSHSGCSAALAIDGPYPAHGYIRAVDAAALRDEFPVLRRFAYLNAGTDGPLPRRALAAAQAELERELQEGRTGAHFQRRAELAQILREGYAALLGCPPSDVALTTSTSEGLGTVLGGLGLGPGDEVLTSDEEHPGLLGALQALRDVSGVRIRIAPFARMADAVTAQTTAVACSHVSWINGSIVPAALAELEIPVILDGAQGVGAVPIDLAELGCDAYAGAGQKWLCGPDGTGVLYVSPALRERVAVTRRCYTNLAQAGLGLESPLREDARRFDTSSLSAEALALAGGALRVLSDAGWPAVHERACALAETFAERLAGTGREVARRGPSTLVSFSSADPETEREQLARDGVIVRNLPGTSWLRASVGAWNDGADLERLVRALRPYEAA